MNDWLFPLWHHGLYCITTTVMNLGFSLRSEGMRNLPAKGPALIIANHQSYLDPVLIGLAARRPLCYLARKSLFDSPAFTWLIRSMNAVPIDQEGLGFEGLRTVLQQLRENRAVVIFPEGSRTPDGTLQPLKPGILLLIKKTQAPIVPVGIAGAFDSWPHWRPAPVPAPLFLPAGKGTLAVSIGQPLAAGRFLDLPRETVLEQLFDELQKVAQRAEKLRRKG